MLTLGIDIGTTSTIGILIDGEGRTQALAQRSVDLHSERPGWAEEPGADVWHWVDDHAEAATLAASLGGRPFLTVGRQALDQFVGPLERHHAVARVVDAPNIVLPAPWTLILSRGPYPVESEHAVFDEHRIDVLVTKDSGGRYTWAKMQVAAERDTPVVIVRRSTPTPDVLTVSEPSVARDWALRIS